MNIKCDYSCKKSYDDNTSSLNGGDCWKAFQTYAPKWCRDHVLLALITLANKHRLHFDNWAIDQLSALNISQIQEACHNATLNQPPNVELLNSLQKQLGPLHQLTLIVLLHRIRYNNVRREYFEEKLRTKFPD